MQTSKDKDKGKDKGTVRVMLVDDHDLITHGTQKFLEQQEEFEVVSTASDGREALGVLNKLAQKNRLPDVLITDINMPNINGVELSQRVRRQWGKQIKIVVVTVHQDRDFLTALLQQGVDGYIAKAAKSTEFLSALRRVVGGEIVVEGVSDFGLAVEVGTPTPLSPLSLPLDSKTVDPAKMQHIEALTERECNVLQYMLLGYDTIKTSKEMGLSRGTVQNYYTDICTKLRVTRNNLLLEGDQWKKALIKVRKGTGTAGHLSR